ncbi:MAG: hypothetical protein JWP81_2619 [Ferruginibacter sp.]|nr:hypothetical protein [Ferruginibacter sp.]
MKKFAFLLLPVLLMAFSSEAKIRRVGFFASPIAGTDYSTFALAYTAAGAGDTVLMFPNTTVSGTLSKKLIIIGAGNWLDPNSTPKGNANQQAFPGEANISSLILALGCEGTVIQGFHNGIIYIAASDITIMRNRDITVYISYTNPAATVSNLQVLQNYKVAIANYYTNASSATNMNISNNLIDYFSTAMGNTYSGTISNNVWAYDATQTANAANGGTSTMSGTNSIELGAGAYLLQYNIFAGYSNAVAASSNNYFYFLNTGNSIFNYNLALQAGSGQPQTFGISGTGNSITVIANAANIFNAFPLIGSSSADARYQLKAGSPALTAGLGGTAVGMYAGNYPYKLSTLPSIPSVYLLSSPQGNNPAGSTIQINVSTKGNN